MTATPEISAMTSETPPGRGRVSYLVLIALAWFQVAFASHQFEHVTGDLLDACTVCKHLERHDAAVAQQPGETTSAAFSPVPVAYATRPSAGPVLRNYESRAPPSA